MKTSPDKTPLLLGAILLFTLPFVSCKPSGDLEQRVTQLSAQVDELKKANTDLKAKFDKDQVAKNARLSNIEGKLEDMDERFTTRGK